MEIGVAGGRPAHEGGSSLLCAAAVKRGLAAVSGALVMVALASTATAEEPERPKSPEQAGVSFTLDPGLPAGAEITIDGFGLPREQWRDRVPLAPGPHQITYHAGRGTTSPAWSVTLDLAAGEAKSIHLGPPPAPPPVPVAGIALAGAGIACTVVGVAFLSMGDRGAPQQATSVAFLGAAAGTLAGAIALLARRPKAPPPPISIGLGGITLRGSF